MREYKKVKIIFLWMLMVSSDTAAQLFIKMGAMRLSSSKWTINHLIILGYSLYIVSFIAWMQILKNTRLFIALSATSVLYITVAFSSYVFLNEKITNGLLAGTILISLGVFVLGWRERNKSNSGISTPRS